MNKINFVWPVKLLVSCLFVLSAFAKLYPIEAFEKQLVDLHLCTWHLAPILARSIIAFELFIGLAFLQNHFFVKLIAPVTIGLLLIFSVHLLIQIGQTGNVGNCGCMGQLIPMTPLQALTKNIVCVGLVFYLRIKTQPDRVDKIIFPLLIFVFSFVFIILMYPVKSQKVVTAAPFAKTNITIDTQVTNSKTTQNVLVLKKDSGSKIIHKSIKKTEKTPTFSGTMPSVNSEFTNYVENHKIDLNEGIKVVCVFNTTCDHCMNVANKICKMSKTSHLPPVYVFFWSEINFKDDVLKKEVDDFYKYAGCEYPFTVLETSHFFRLLGKAPYPPRIVVLDNGNIVKEFTGDNFEKDFMIPK